MLLSRGKSKNISKSILKLYGNKREVPSKNDFRAT